MAPTERERRVQRDVRRLRQDPPPLVLGFALEERKMRWVKVAVAGPPASPYEGGVYVFQIDIPRDYPHKPPEIKVLTPSGRFQTMTSVCVDGITAHHTESWSPLHSLSSVCVAFVSFMSDDHGGLASIKASTGERRALARASDSHNEKALFYKGMHWVRERPTGPPPPVSEGDAEAAGRGAGAGSEAGAGGRAARKGTAGGGEAVDRQVRTPATHDLGALTVPVLTLGAMCLAAAVKRWYLEPQG